MRTASIRKTIARRIPAMRPRGMRGKMPDVAARLEKVFGRKIISGQTIKEILDDNRGNY